MSKPDDGHIADSTPKDHHQHASLDKETRQISEEEFSKAISRARTGLRSQVKDLVDVLDGAQAYIPLAEDLPDAPLGEKVPFDEDLTFRPHMILNEDHSVFAVAYSDPQLCDKMQAALEWSTSGEDLKFICVGAQVALELCETRIDDEEVAGIVFNPGTDHELVLKRDEVSSLSQGVAIPLVGYVADLPQDDSETQVVEGADPPPAELLDALTRAKESIADLLDFKVQTTFNPERDREPHLSIVLTVIGRHGLDRQVLADEVMEEAAPHLPAPGYADLIFLDAPN